MSGYHCEYCGKLNHLETRCDCDTAKAMQEKERMMFQQITRPTKEQTAWLVARSFGSCVQWLKTKGYTFLWTDDATAATRFADKPSAELVTLDLPMFDWNIRIEDHQWPDGF